VHRTTHLEVAWQQLQIWVYSQQVVAAQLGADVLRDEVNGHQVVTTLPGDDDVGISAKVTCYNDSRPASVR
jgi:hypothetical protein